MSGRYLAVLRLQAFQWRNVVWIEISEAGAGGVLHSVAYGAPCGGRSRPGKYRSSNLERRSLYMSILFICVPLSEICLYCEPVGIIQRVFSTLLYSLVWGLLVVTIPQSE